MLGRYDLVVHRNYKLFRNSLCVIIFSLVHFLYSYSTLCLLKYDFVKYGEYSAIILSNNLPNEVV